MKSAEYDAIVVAGGGLTTENNLTPRAARRMDTALSLFDESLSGNLALSGGYSFMLDSPPVQRESDVMRQYAVERGVPDKVIYNETESLDTIGNALYTKLNIVQSQDWQRLMVVTSDSHLPRTLSVFRHVLGGEYDIAGAPAPENVTVKERVYERIGVVMAREVLRGTKPGDHEAIQDRLFDLVPGYADASKLRLARQSLLGLMKPSDRQ